MNRLVEFYFYSNGGYRYALNIDDSNEWIGTVRDDSFVGEYEVFTTRPTRVSTDEEVLDITVVSVYEEKSSNHDIHIPVREIGKREPDTYPLSIEADHVWYIVDSAGGFYVAVRSVDDDV